MKKFMTVMLGMSLMLGSAAFAFGDDPKPATATTTEEAQEGQEEVDDFDHHPGSGRDSGVEVVRTELRNFKLYVPRQTGPLKGFWRGIFVFTPSIPKNWRR